MKNYKIIAFSILACSMGHAQTLEDAIKKTDNERYDLAETEFKALIAKEPAKGNNYFYYGENFLLRGELDSANIIWQKGATMDPAEPLNFVGLGTYLWYKGDTTAARKQFSAVATMTKNKNAEVMRKTASPQIYAPLKNLNEAITLLNSAIKAEPKNIDNYLLLGDALLEKTPSDGSPAILNYNKALDLNPKSSRGIVRTAKLYQRAENYELANEKYQEAQALDPTYAPAYRENAELNMKFNQSTKAIENWKKYLELNNSTEARYRFASALILGKKYCEAIPELERIQSEGFTNFYTKRMLTYSYFECNENGAQEIYQKGLDASGQFFAIAPSEKIIASDYRYKGMLLSKLGNDSLAIVELEKAVALDSSNAKDLLGDIGKLNMKMKKYDRAIIAYERKLGTNAENLNAQEYFELGRAYYFGSKDYVKADSAFSKLTAIAPTFSVAYLWRARSNYKLDPKNELWQAKPHYEKYVELVTPEERLTPSHKPLVIEASKYLGDYYVNSKEKDLTKAKMYWNIVRELDPADKQAKAFFAPPAGK